ncbi:hypothetical protein MBLL_00613 (plasmid) [Methylobacterium bullatum]|uniref:Uncharacterized protein n=1 Tax=Methylobacterium bullatum TaxID=570505 RepID=A0A679JWZ8_9HYPH|nr:hypothetical protein MBLL_00613 [Methylobacterium bullatum]
MAPACAATAVSAAAPDRCSRPTSAGVAAMIAGMPKPKVEPPTTAAA